MTQAVPTSYCLAISHIFISERISVMCHACGRRAGLRNSECHVCVRMALIGSRTAPGRAKGLEENGAGPSGGGERERGIFKHRGQGQARWAFRAWGSGGDGIYPGAQRPFEREDGGSVHLATTDARFMAADA